MRALVSLVFGLASLTCSQGDQPVAPLSSVKPASLGVSVSAPSRDPVGSCRNRIKKARAKLRPRAPLKSSLRGMILARAKASPVVFKRVPRVSFDASAEVRGYRRLLASSPAPGFALRKLYPVLANRPEVARSLLLREGYLYAESPSYAAALAETVKLHHLFQAPEIVVQRGERRRVARRQGKFYVHESAEGKPEKARILLFDRVWKKDEPPKSALHVSLDSLQKRWGFERVRNLRIGQAVATAELGYGDVWVPTLLRRNRSALRLECQQIAPSELVQVKRVRQLNRRRRKALGALKGHYRCHGSGSATLRRASHRRGAARRQPQARLDLGLYPRLAQLPL